MEKVTEQIEMSLKDEPVSSNRSIICIRSVLVFFLVSMVGVTVICAFCLEGTFRVVMITLCDVLFLGFLLLMIYFLHQQKKLRRKIQKCLEDAHSLTAYSKEIASYLSSVGMIPPIIKRIQLRFSIDGKKYKINSPVGRSGYNKYADKEVEILYSPKYDEAFILKQK